MERTSRKEAAKSKAFQDYHKMAPRARVPKTETLSASVGEKVPMNRGRMEEIADKKQKGGGGGGERAERQEKNTTHNSQIRKLDRVTENNGVLAAMLRESQICLSFSDTVSIVQK